MRSVGANGKEINLVAPEGLETLDNRSVGAGQMIDRLKQHATAQQALSLTQEDKHASHPVHPVR